MDNLPTFRGEAKLTTWVHRIAVYTALIHCPTCLTTASPRSGTRSGRSKLEACNAPSPNLATKTV